MIGMSMALLMSSCIENNAQQLDNLSEQVEKKGLTMTESEWTEVFDTYRNIVHSFVNGPSLFDNDRSFLDAYARWGATLNKVNASSKKAAKSAINSMEESDIKQMRDDMKKVHEVYDRWRTVKIEQLDVLGNLIKEAQERDSVNVKQ